MDNYIGVFSNIKIDVKHKILWDIYNFTYMSENALDVHDKERLYRRLDFLEETSIRYIFSNVCACLCGSNEANIVLKSYGLDLKKYDDYSDIRVLEKTLNDVLSYLEYDFSLPSVDDINREVSVFGFTYESDPKKFNSLYGALYKCDSPLFYEMYSFACSKGMSDSEIFSSFCRIFKMLSYYNYNSLNSSILSYVPFLNCEVEEFFRKKQESFSLRKK